MLEETMKLTESDFVYERVGKNTTKRLTENGYKKFQILLALAKLKQGKENE